MVDCEVTSPIKTITLDKGRRLSDYNLLVIAVSDSDYFRNPSVIPMDVFANGPINSVEIDYNNANANRWVSVKYVSDTQIGVFGESNATQRLYLFGIKLVVD